MLLTKKLNNLKKHLIKRSKKKKDSPMKFKCVKLS